MAPKSAPLSSTTNSDVDEVDIKLPSTFSTFNISFEILVEALDLENAEFQAQEIVDLLAPKTDWQIDYEVDGILDPESGNVIPIISKEED